jgi:hypothetical protein
MKNLLPILILLVLAALRPLTAQTVILDFESTATSTTFQYFGSSLDGGLTSVIANPNPTGINTSSNVTRYVKAAGAQTWAGAFSNPNPATPVNLSASTQVCINVHFDHIGNVAIKLENSPNGGANWVQTQPNTTTNQWETVCFDVTLPSLEAPFSPAAGNTYNTVTLFFDFGTAGTDADQVFFFDDIVVPANVSCTPVLDFETPESSTVFQYFGSSLDASFTAIIDNPNPSGINNSSKVLQFVKPADAQTWAGAFSNPNPATPVNLSNGGQVCIKVHMDHPGNLTIKLENSSSGGANWLQTVQNTTINAWTELCFDTSLPSLEAPFTPASGNIYNTITLFVDFGIPGNESAATSYLDDISVCSSGGPQSADVTFSVDMSDYTGNFSTVYVSGSFNNWSGDANPLSDANGDGIWEATLTLPTGSYEYKFTLDNWSAQEQFTGTETCVITDPSGQFTNRRLIVSSTGADTPTVCWNSCYACGESVKITINLGASHITVAPTGMFIAGGGNFGIPGDFPLSDPDGDGIWSITIEKPRSFASYFTFTNGSCPDYSCKENIAGQDCANPDNFNDRFMGPIQQDTVIATCFALCTTDTNCSGGVANGNITFRVDMRGYAGSFSQVYVSGSFNGWSGDAFPLSDADGDQVWSGTYLITGGQHEYKFTLDNWSAQEQFNPGSACTITDPSGQFTNRLLEVDGDATLDAVCFNSCVACVSATANVQQNHQLFYLAPNIITNTAWLVFQESNTDDRLLQIFNALGQVQLSIRIDRHTNRFPLELGQLPAGMYTAHISTGNVIATRKFIKQ